MIRRGIASRVWCQGKRKGQGVSAGGGYRWRRWGLGEQRMGQCFYREMSLTRNWKKIKYRLQYNWKQIHRYQGARCVTRGRG